MKALKEKNLLEYVDTLVANLKSSLLSQLSTSSSQSSSQYFD